MVFCTNSSGWMAGSKIGVSTGIQLDGSKGIVWMSQPALTTLAKAISLPSGLTAGSTAPVSKLVTWKSF
ncbi:hypothetical protein D3C78_1869360 [compost metagenome]